MQSCRVVYHGISHLSLVFSRYTQSPKFKWQVGYSMVYHEKVFSNYFIPCHRKYSGQHNQWDIRADFILNGFQLAFNRPWRFVNTAALNTFKIVFFFNFIAQITRVHVMHAAFRNLGGNKIRSTRWEGWVEYRRINNGFPEFWLAVFSMAWYKSLLLPKYDDYGMIQIGGYNCSVCTYYHAISCVWQIEK